MQIHLPQRSSFLKLGFSLLLAFFVQFLSATKAEGKIVIEKQSNLGVIKGFIRDEQGKPISNGVVALFRSGTSKLLKQVRSATDGSFLARILPGKYTILAVAQGYNPVTLQEVQVNRATEMNYGFKLEKAGSGNTLPEKRFDRDSSRWRIRAAQNRRSIYQAKEGEKPVAENKTDENTVAKEPKKNVEESIGISEEEPDIIKRKSRSVVETYFASSSEGGFAGFNFATMQPINEDVEIIFSGQAGTKSFAPQRFETTLKARPNDKHQFRLSAAAAKIGQVKNGQESDDLGQVSFQALDEWKIKDGVIVVVGVDFSRFIGAGDDASISPRLGFQFDADAKTRIKAAYTTQNEERTWGEAIDLEGSQILFRQSTEAPAIAMEDAKPVMNKSRRLEFGIERVLDNSSSIEATAFFDSVSGRGVGLVNMPLGFLNSTETEGITANQTGKAQGFRLVYSRRFGKTISASAAYSFGNGQKLSPEAISDPANVFQNAFFQTFAGQVNADFKTGTRLKTIFRLSPEATVFAIDPFAGKLAIYDPSLSVVVTHPLPNLGLPIRAQAVIDARNLFDFQTFINGEEGSIRLNSHRRMFRGGIQVRF